MSLVSVIIPVYNCGNYLEKCLKNVTDQTYSNLEILVSDDASTDKSLEIVNEFSARDTRIKVFRQGRNLGYLKNYNFLLGTASGNFIAVQDADDWSDINRIDKQVKCMNANPDILLNGVASVFHFPKLAKEIIGYSDEFLDGPTKDYKFVPASLMIRSAVLGKVPGMNDWFDQGTSMDRYFINRILQTGRGYFINDPLYHVNVRPNSNHKQFSYKKITSLYLCDKLIDQMIETGTDWLASGNIEAIRAFENAILSDRKKISEAYRASAVFDVEFRNYRHAFDLLVKSFRNDINPSNLRTFFYLIRSLAGLA